ncbi:hypothetical protein Q3O59_04690 [Alkalimonas delamerensis]|uniref:Protein FliT n=1 Tax=Alkalimonas delamerensis TaxID=265981 RepID=A0ABT9GN11_9GAMM|nr:hypothetical protein [Alkalimonas delamerensis]MDP4528327.1 hypothetical protein [Alkalimonas delamerensis]
MPSFDAWQHGYQQLRAELELLLNTELPDYQAAEKQLSKLHSHIQSGLDIADEQQQYGIFLQEQLDWLQGIIAVLSKQKDSMAADLLQLERRKKARDRYNQHT